MATARRAAVEEAEQAGWPPAFVINTGTEEWLVQRSWRTYAIPGRGKERFAALRIDQQELTIDEGNNRKSRHLVTPRKIAADLVREIQKDMAPGQSWGLLVSATAKPSEEQLQEAEAQRLKWLKACVQYANDEWARGRNSLRIGDFQRRAAEEIGFDAEWRFDPQQKEDCPRCGERVKPNVAMCIHCGAILNREKYETYEASPAPDRAKGKKNEAQA